MKTQKIASLAALLCLSVAVPAYAAWDNIGSIDVGGRDNGRGFDDRDHRHGGGFNGPGMQGRDMGREVRTFTFGGPVEALQLRAERSDINCQSVNATFADGQRRNVFSGRLRENRPADVDMPGSSRSIRALDFNCTADRGDMATIHIVADVGRYRQEWQRNPDFNRTWAKVFNWGSDMVNNWRMIGSERFDGPRDSETSFPGRRGLHVDAIALKPLETDARCSRVTARFGTRGSQNLAIHAGDTLKRGQYFKLDLPGDTRDVTSLQMNCGAVGGPYVTMQIFTSK